MTAPFARTLSVSSRLRVIAAHLGAVDRLLAAGRTLDAVAQLRAVRAALGAVASQICRRHAVHCLGAGTGAPERDELLTVLRWAILSRTHRTRQHRRTA